MPGRRRVLITGASSGVGRAAAEAFAEAGYDVAVLARSEEGLEAAAAAAREHGAATLVLPADVSEPDALQAAVDRIEAEWGGLDALVLNAAITIFGPFTEVSAEDFERVIDVTFLGAVNVTRAALPSLIRSQGTIVATGSLNSRVPLPAWSSYAAAKHAERGFLNTLAIEMRAEQTGVRVAQLHPGPINTPVWEQTKSATGFLPRRPPDGYPPEQVAEGLVNLVEHPRNEVLFGAEAIAVDRLWSVARGAGDLVLGAVYHYFMSGHRPAQRDVDALREAVGKGIAPNGLVQRPSVTAVVRGIASFGTAGIRFPRRR